MGAKRDHFDSFELVAYLPTDIVDPKLQSIWTI